MSKLFLLLAVIVLNIQLNRAEPPSDLIPVILLPYTEYHCCSENETNRKVPTVYCYYGTNETLLNIWQSVSVSLEMKNPKEYDLYKGEDESDVWNQFEKSQSRWGFDIFNRRPKSIALNPFHTTCLGIRASKNYRLKVQVTQVNIVMVGMCILGALLFFCAPILIHSQLFYHAIGIAVGVLASVLVCMYFIITLLPLKRPAMLGIMAGGSSIVLLFFQTLLDNFLVLIQMYSEFLYGYLIVSAFLSFAVCYRFGPLSNPRTMNLIQWTLQILSLGLVFYSSYQKVTVALDIMIVLLYKLNIMNWMIGVTGNHGVTYPNNTKLVDKGNKISIHSNRPLRRRSRYLTEEEYRKQGRVETDRSLAELRRYCKTVKISWAAQRIDPNNFERFERFINGSPHVSKKEFLAKIKEELSQLTDGDK